MNPEVRFSVADRLRSFRHALRGLWVLIQSQHNARMHLLAAVCVIAAGVSLRLSILQLVI